MSILALEMGKVAESNWKFFVNDFEYLEKFGICFTMLRLFFYIGAVARILSTVPTVVGTKLSRDM